MDGEAWRAPIHGVKKRRHDWMAYIHATQQKAMGADIKTMWRFFSLFSPTNPLGYKNYRILFFSSVQSLSRVGLLATSWMAARQAYLVHHQLPEFTKPTSIELVMPSSHLILCHPLLLLPQSLPASESFPMSQLFAWGGHSTGVLALASFPSKEHPGLISFRIDWLELLAGQGTLKIFSNTTVQKHQFFGAQLSSQSNSHLHTWPLEKP